MIIYAWQIGVLVFWLFRSVHRLDGMEFLAPCICAFSEFPLFLGV